MSAQILAQCELGACVDGQFPTPTGGVTKGEVFQAGDSIFFAFTKANPEDAIAGPLTSDPDHTMAGFEDIFTGIKKCPKALVKGAATGTGAPTFDKGQDVFFNIATQAVSETKTSTSVWIGQTLEEKLADQPDFLIEFDGSNPARSQS